MISKSQSKTIGNNATIGIYTQFSVRVCIIPSSLNRLKIIKTYYYVERKCEFLLV